MSENKATVGIYTLGCKVNQYESEAIAEKALSAGLQIMPPTARCDAYIINTCTVTSESDRKARQFIRRAIHQNPNAYILVTGCLSQTQPENVAAIKGVDYICGNADKQSVIDAALTLLQAGKKNVYPVIQCPPPDSRGFECMQITHFDRTRAYVKIEDGCESHCTYCIIPHARGAIRSKAPADVLREVEGLVRGGCREVVLTGIETASYGKDLTDCNFADLLSMVDKIPNIGRVRLGSLDPSLMKQPFVDRIAPLSSLAPHFHLSMQSGSDKILALMKRKYNSRMAIEGMERLRRAIPDVQFTTDMIVGFPQETEEDFAETLDFVRKARFLMIHVFPYSRREGTPAAAMTGQIPQEVKHARVKRLQEVQERIRAEILTEQLGRECEVLFETYSDGFASGHTKSFIEVTCPAARSFDGEICIVRLLEVTNNGCIGEILSHG